MTLLRGFEKQSEADGEMPISVLKDSRKPEIPCKKLRVSNEIKEEA